MAHLGYQWDLISEYRVCKFTISQSPHYMLFLHTNEHTVLQKYIKEAWSIDIKVEKKINVK